MYTDDPVADFLRHDAEQSKLIENLPQCEECGHEIQQVMAVCIHGAYYCDDCLENMRVSIGDD